MLAYIIKFYFIFLCSIYICFRITNCTFVTTFQKLYLSIFPLILSSCSYLINLHLAELTYIVPVLLLWVSISILTTGPQVSFVTTMISFGITYSIWVLSGFVAVFIMLPFHYNGLSSPYLALAIVTSTLQTIFVKTLFSIKRFRKGMPFLSSTTFINIATIICLLLIGFLIYIQSNLLNFHLRLLSLLLFIISLGIIIHWWQAQITKSYRRALQLRELESLRTELQEKDKLISDLTKKNEQLGRLIHKDNKLIPAMENAVCDYLISDFTDSKATLDKGNSLLLEVKNLSNNRANVLSEIYESKCRQFSTGIPSLDTLLNYMDKRAGQDKLKLSVHIALDLNNYIPQTISSDDLVHLLSDLLENALIASENIPDGIIQLQFYQSQKSFVIEVADNGIPFEAASLVNMGLTQLTTHADSGGSGIGLMDIWEIKGKYRASLNIREYDTPSPYSKKISIIFNKKNQYSVETWRNEEIEFILKRSDLQIYDYKD